MTPADWERKASHADAQAEQLAAENRIAEAVVMSVKAARFREVAAALREHGTTSPLRNTKQRGNVRGMTDAQKADRAGAIAKAKTRGTRDKLQKAIQASSWKTHNRYARERLGISPAMLTHYKGGVHPVPARIADLIRLDFGLTIGKSE